MKKIIIGVTDCSKYDNYAKWVASEPNVETIQLGYKLNNFKDIEKCHGVLLSGGEDVHPRFYNKPEYLSFCYRDDVDEKRDEFELKVLAYSQERNIPLFGICRGLQIANVFFGGSLLPDLLKFKSTDHSKINGEDRYHTVTTEAASLLRNITGLKSGEINSAHHQSVDRLGEGLVISALSDEGVIEGVERKKPDDKSLLLLVQWHPERMMDQASAFSKNTKSVFLDAVKTLNN